MPNPQQTGKDGLLRENVFNTFKGLDTSSPLTAMEADSLRIADNCHVSQSGTVDKRKGYTQQLTVSVWGPKSIRGGIEYQPDSSTTENIVFGHESAATSGAIGIATTSVADIITGLDNQRPSIIQFNKLLFFYNGTDDFLYDGTTTRQIGITPPAGAPTGVSNTNGSLVVGASYKAVYTYYNSVTGAESSPSPLSDAVVVAADPNDGITWTVVAGDATTADTIRLYRTVANGAALFLDNTAAIGAVSVTSTQADAGLIQPLELDNTRIGIWGNPKYASALNNRVGVTGFASPNENRFRVSKLGLSGAMPESFEANSFTDCVSAKGFQDTNVGVGAANGNWIILKKNSVGRVDVDSSYIEKGLVTSQEVDGIVLNYVELSKVVTSVSHWAQTNVYNNLVWLGRDNIYMTDGQQVVPVADKIANDIKGYDWTAPEKLSGHNDLRNRRVYFTVMSSSSVTEPDYVLVGSYKDYPNFYWTKYRIGAVPATHPGIRAGCFIDFKTSSGNYEVFFGNTDYSGKLYKMNTGDNDDSLGIYFRVADAPVSYGLPEEKKLFIKDIIWADTTPATTSLVVGAFYDLSDQVEDSETVNTGLAGSYWDAASWDIDDWSDEGQIRVEHSTHRKAFYKQLYFTDTAADEPVVIKGWTKVARPQEFK